MLRATPIFVLTLMLFISQQGHAGVSLQVMAYNIFQLAATEWDQQARAYRLETQLRTLHPQPDVLVLNEVFSKSAEQLLNNVRDLYPYQTPNVGESCFKGWDAITGNCSNFPLISRGGVVILSKHPIEYQHAHIYQASLKGTWDHLANKGFAYIRINKGGLIFHIIGTHLQATHDDIADKEHQVRIQQLQEMAQILNQYAIDRQQPVIYAGDMNIPWEDKTQLDDMLTTLNAKLVYDKHNIPSFSAQHNWLTKLFYRRFGGNMNNEESLDYILLSTNHRQATLHAPQKTLILRTPFPWFWSKMAGHWPLEDGPYRHSGFYNELSDHYPVWVDFVF